MYLGGFLRTLMANTLTAGFGRAISKKAVGLMSPMPSSRSEAYLDFGFLAIENASAVTALRDTGLQPQNTEGKKNP